MNCEVKDMGTAEKRATILFVDDEEAIGRCAGMALRYYGFSVAAYSSGASALEAFRESPGQFDVVVTDQSMPGMTGTVLARHLAAIEPAIPIIICSGGVEDIQDPRDTNSAYWQRLKKPLSMERLASAIQDALSRGAARKLST